MKIHIRKNQTDKSREILGISKGLVFIPTPHEDL